MQRGSSKLPRDSQRVIIIYGCASSPEDIDAASAIARRAALPVPRAALRAPPTDHPPRRRDQSDAAWRKKKGENSFCPLPSTRGDSICQSRNVPIGRDPISRAGSRGHLLFASARTRLLNAAAPRFPRAAIESLIRSIHHATSRHVADSDRTRARGSRWCFCFLGRRAVKGSLGATRSAQLNQARIEGEFYRARSV